LALAPGTRGLHDLVLDLVEGETLAKRLERGAALPTNEALRIARQMAEALEAVHEKGWSERTGRSSAPRGTGNAIRREESDNDSVLRLT